MLNFLNKIFCKHKHNEVVCWHWTHYPDNFNYRSIEAQLKCKYCGKYHFLHIHDLTLCDMFIKKHKDKEYSDVGKPLLN